MKFSNRSLIIIAALACVLHLHNANAELTNVEIKVLLTQHNSWRAKFNMPPLVWDATVAAVAQAWADQIAATGRFEHSQDGRYGENLWGGTAGSFPIASVVDGWGNEQDNYDVSTNTCAEDKECGHFTQVVWWNTTKLGCGKATRGDGNDAVVCNYDPAGNFNNQNPFGK
jgi:pathogenesis-related protein 1